MGLALALRFSASARVGGLAGPGPRSSSDGVRPQLPRPSGRLPSLPSVRASLHELASPGGADARRRCRLNGDRQCEVSNWPAAARTPSGPYGQWTPEPLDARSRLDLLDGFGPSIVMPGRPARRRDLGSYPLVDVVADVPRESVPPGRHDKRVSTAGISRNRS